MDKLLSIKDAIKLGIKHLTSVSDTPRLDAEILLAHTLQINVDQLFFKTHNLTDEELKNFTQYLDDRKKLKPIAYILGTKEFWGLDFKVDESVLVPRPDTEILIEAATSLFKKEDEFNFIDLGTGSGCIGLTIASIFKKSTGTLLDKSSKALNIAKENCEALQLNSQITLLESDWFSAVENKKFDLIISNPPYISKDFPDTGSIKHEPDSALFADDNGLEEYKIIAKSAKNYLAQDGYIILEIGFDQADSVSQIFDEYNFIKKIKDYGNNDRVLIFKSL